MRPTPNWVEWLHSLVSYGEEPARARRQRSHWSSHIDSLTDDLSGASGWRLRRAGAVAAAAATHVGNRMAHGPVTAIPAGLLMTLGSLSSLSLAFAPPADDIPTWVHAYTAFAALFFGVALLRNPRRLGPSAIGGLVLVGLVPVSALRHLEIQAGGDWLILIGWVAVGAGAAVAATSAATVQRNDLTRAGLAIVAAGVLLVGLGNAAWTRIVESPATFAACLMSSIVAALAAVALWNLRALPISGSTTPA